MKNQNRTNVKVNTITRVNTLSLLLILIAIMMFGTSESLAQSGKDPCKALFGFERKLCNNELVLGLPDNIYDIIWEDCGTRQEITAYHDLVAVDMTDRECILFHISYKGNCSSEGSYHKPQIDVFHRVLDGAYSPQVSVEEPDDEFTKLTILEQDWQLQEIDIKDDKSQLIDSLQGVAGMTFTTEEDCPLTVVIDLAEPTYVDYKVHAPSCGSSDGYIEIEPTNEYEIISSDWTYEENEKGLSLYGLDDRTESERLVLQLLDKNSSVQDTIMVDYNFEFSECVCRNLFTEEHITRLEAHLSGLRGKEQEMSVHGMAVRDNIFSQDSALHHITIDWLNDSEMGRELSYLNAEAHLYVPYLIEKGLKEIEIVHTSRYKDCKFKVELEIE